MKRFITFGDSGITNSYKKSMFKGAAERLCRQAESLNLFDNIENNNLDTLESDFYKKHENFMLNNKGLGFWIWKPYIINRMFNKSEDGDKILYLDAGCEFRENAVSLLRKKLNDTISVHSYIMEGPVRRRGAEYKTTNEVWCKQDAIKTIGVNDKVLKSEMHQGGCILFTVNPETRKLVSEWERYSTPELLNDKSNKHENLSCFFRHSHDQSILSLLIGKSNIKPKSDLEECFWYIRNKSPKQQDRHLPGWENRRISGIRNL